MRDTLHVSAVPVARNYQDRQATFLPPLQSLPARSAPGQNHEQTAGAAQASPKESSGGPARAPHRRRSKGYRASLLTQQSPEHYAAALYRHRHVKILSEPHFLAGGQGPPGWIALDSLSHNTCLAGSD